MSRCRIVGAVLTSPMLPYATDNSPGFRRLSDGPVAPPCQFVPGVVADDGLAGVDALAVQLGERALHVPPHHADGDSEDALAALEQGWTSSGDVHSYTVAPSLISVIRSRSRKPRSLRCCTVVRMFCRETPVSRKRLTIFRTTTSRKL